MNKLCSKCKKNLPFEAFHKASHTSTGRAAWCKLCIGVYNKLRMENNPRLRRDTHLRATYNMSLETYEAIERAQDGVCAICKQPERKGYPLSVDHDHATKENRGLLCNDCNVMLGRAKDSTEILTTAITYLKRYRT